MYTRTTLLALAAAVAAAPTASEGGPLHLPINGPRLEPRADGSADIAALLTQLNNTFSKYNSERRLLPLSQILGGSSLDGILEDRAVGKVPLKDQATDVLYYGNGKVGSQTFTIDFDTGSADFFVPGPNCPTCHGTPYSETGTNRQTTTSVTYGSGQVSGNDFFDTVCVGGLCAPQTNVISLTTAKGFSTSKSSSLMGMGFSTIANSKQPTFFENLIKGGKVTSKEFSFYLGRKKSKTNKKSVMTLGGRDSSKFTGKPKSHKVTKKGYWQLAIDGMAVDGGNAIGTAGQSAIDTGTTVIIAPTVAATSLFTNIPGSFPVPLASGSPTETIFAIPCDTTSKVSLVFGGVKYEINALDLTIGTLTPGLLGQLGLPGLGSGLCAASIIGADLMPGQEFYVVGDSFLKNWYSIYSYNGAGSVSFAKSV